MTPRDAEFLILGVLGALAGATLVYLGVSYAMMAAHTDPRPGRHHAGAILREFYYVMITQPLVPLYYLIGRRMGPGNGTPVIFVHGYFQNRADFWWLAREFRRASLGPLYGFNYPWFQQVGPSVARLDRFVESSDQSSLKLAWEVEIASEPPAMIRALKPKLWFVGELEMQRGCFYKLA